jgi:hypothetical protein
VKSIIRKDKMYKKYVNKPTESNKKMYVNYRNKLTSLIRISRRNYYTDKLEESKHDTKQTWNVLNNILGRHTRTPISSRFKVGNSHITDPQTIANQFNNYFTNVGSNLARDIPAVNIDYNHFLKNVASPCNSLFLTPTDSDEVVKICSTLKSSSSTGHDDIKPDIVKSVIDSIAQPLAHIVNRSFITGIIPEPLMIAKVIPIFKKGEQDVFSNYRPISILPFFSKIFERLVHKRLYAFISRHQLLHSNQFGFRPKMSCEMALLEAYNNIVSNLDKKNHTLGIFLDLSKAFDTIDHDILLFKLSHYGIRGVALDWLRNYLIRRMQFVSFNGQNSTHLKTNCGVPQGSILGPLLFIIYINDLVDTSISSNMILYADDTNLLFSHSDLNQLVDHVNSDLINITNWFKVNKLSLNINKSNYMIFKNRYSNRNYEDLNIFIDKNRITRVPYVKFLGVTVDECLTWNNHTVHIANLVSKYSGILFRLKPYLSINILFSLYNTLVLPHLMYCNLIWADSNNTHLDIIHRKQKRIIRLCTNAGFLEHTPPLFARLNTLTIKDLHNLSVATFMYKFKNNMLPENLSSLFATVKSIYTHGTRSSNLYRPHHFVTNLAMNTIRRQGPLLWNGLDAHIRASTSLNIFKNVLKRRAILLYH